MKGFDMWERTRMLKSRLVEALNENRWPASRVRAVEYTALQTLPRGSANLGFYEAPELCRIRVISVAIRWARNIVTRACATAIVGVWGACAAIAATNDPTALLQQGLFEEEANHNYGAASQAYQSLLSQFDSNRVLAATAIFRLGEIYRRQGKTNEAAAQYQRIVQEFPDQEVLAKLSRENLPSGGDVRSSRNSNEAQQLLKTLKSLSSPEQALLIQQQEPNSLLTTLLQEQQSTERKLAERKQEVGPQHPEIIKLQAMLQELNRQIDDQVKTTVGRLESELAGTPPSKTAQTASPELERIRELIRNSPDLINAAQKNGETLLEAAAGKGNLDVVKLLLENGAVVNGIKTDALTPLHFAAGNGHKTVVDYLLAHGANPAVATSQGLTPLHLAAGKGYVAVANALLEKGAPINAESHQVFSLQFEDLNFASAYQAGRTPLRLALEAQYQPMVQLLISKGADVNIQDEQHCTPLHVATHDGEETILKALLKAGANPNVPDYSPLLLACREKSTNSARILLEAGADPNTNGHAVSINGIGSDIRSPLGFAIGAKSLPLVELLLKFKADPNALSGDTPPVILAAEEPDILSVLLEHGASANERKAGDCEMALAKAAGHNNLKSVRLLLGHGGDVNETVSPCWPLVVYGVDHCIPEVYSALLESHSDLNATVTGETTALHRAVYLKKTEHLKLLLEHGADPNVRDASGRTPLAMAKGLEPPDAGIRNLRPIPSRTVRIGAGTPPTQGPEERPPALMIRLLREHGARDDLPELDRIQVRRASANYSTTAFRTEADGWNDFTLLEVLGKTYGLLSDERRGAWRRTQNQTAHNLFKATMPYPYMSSLMLMRVTPDRHTWTNQVFDATRLLDNGTCSDDIILQPGDVLEIPEADHPVAESWPGFSDSQIKSMVECLSRTITIRQRGSKATLTLKPVCEKTGTMSAPGGMQSLYTYAPSSFMIRSVLDQMLLIRTSSELSLVKVTRPKGRNGKEQVWTLDCSNPETAPAFWLRDGDVVEIPDKQ